MSFLFLLALAILLIHILTLADIGRGLLKMTWLGNISSDFPDPAPRVSIIVPACNEEQTLEPALKTLLAQDYPNLEIIAVNDRSTDGTGELLARLQQECSQPFTVITISDLPAGWLGKSHALQIGAESATGEILLFTDADITMEKTTIARAATLMQSKKLDQLSLLFQSLGGNWLLNGMILDTASGLLTVFRPWRAEDDKSRYFIGVGAFNMVRASAYQAVAGHSSISMHPIDDVMLGKIIKEHGFQQMCLLGQPFVTVRWYATATEMVNGLMKNVFSVVHYRVWLAILGMFTVGILTIAPVFGLVMATGATQLLFGASVFLRLAALLWAAKLSGMSVSAVAGGMLAPCMSVYIVGRSVYTTLKNKGIFWRGKHYSLKELRKSRPLLF